MADNQVGPAGNVASESLAPTMKRFTFELNLSGFASGMDSSTPPRLISTLQLSHSHQIQLQLMYADDNQRNFHGRSSLYQYQLLLNKSVDFPVKISARWNESATKITQLSRSAGLLNGDLVAIQPGVPLPIVGITLNQRLQGGSPPEFKLLLDVQFNTPSADAAEVFPTGQVGHMRSHGEQLGSLLSLGHFADCKVVTNDGKFYDCHKALLNLKSEVFQRAFEADMTEGKSNQIRMDCDSDMADLILPFFYTGQMPKVTKESAMELYRIAHLYQIEGLRAFLAEEIMLKANQLVDVSNVFQFAVFADNFVLKVFGQFCIKFIHENRREVVKLPQWKEFRSAIPDLLDQLMSV